MENKKVDIQFRNKEHEKFYWFYFSKCRFLDVYHAALIYCLGIDRDTREHIHEIYDLETGYVKPECLNKGWQSSGSEKVIRMAFNLYNNGTPSVYEYKDSQKKLTECEQYTVEKLFCCGYAPYFWQALKIRYPEYCGAA